MKNNWNENSFSKALEKKHCKKFIIAKKLKPFTYFYNYIIIQYIYTYVGILYHGCIKDRLRLDDRY